jgi:hypothetical protein
MRLQRIEEAVPYPGFADWAVGQRLLTPAQVREASEDLLPTLFARLRDTQEPVGRAGDSIVIYRVP